ncbi:MAG: Hpt domain-containing protein [Asticcacaulis sp.]
MNKANQVQVIQVPNTLRAKVGGRFGGMEQDAIAKAEAALADLSSQFDTWLADEIDKLDVAHADIKANGLDETRSEALYFRVHDLKGLGTTYGFPIITRIAGSLCKMLDDADKREKAPAFLIDAHLDAIKAAVRGNIRDENHPVGVALAMELESRVAEHLKVHNL